MRSPFFFLGWVGEPRGPRLSAFPGLPARTICPMPGPVAKASGVHLENPLPSRPGAAARIPQAAERRPVHIDGNEEKGRCKWMRERRIAR